MAFGTTVHYFCWRASRVAKHRPQAKIGYRADAEEALKT
jgi:hypothetical protein